MALTVPEPIIHQHEDGCITITVGDLSGTVSSYHLLDPKINQLVYAYRKKHGMGVE